MAEEENESREEEWLRSWIPLAVDYGEYDPLRAGSIDGTDTTPHDRGIVRAMTAKYKPPKDLESDPYHTVFVGRIHHDTTEDTLREIFSEYGKIESLRLVRDRVTGRPKGYAFIEYRHTDEAETAYQRCHRRNVDGSQIIVEFECGRTLPGWVPRRLGGGFGGKKESGQLRFGGRERPFRKPIVMGSKILGSRGRGRDSSEGVSRQNRRRDWERRDMGSDRGSDRERGSHRDATEGWTRRSREASYIDSYRHGHSSARERHGSPKRHKGRHSRSRSPR